MHAVTAKHRALASPCWVVKFVAVVERGVAAVTAKTLAEILAGRRRRYWLGDRDARTSQKFGKFCLKKP